MQQGLLLESSLANRPWANLEQIIIEAPADAFDAERLRRVWTILARRHDALRMRLEQDTLGHICQHILPEPEIVLHVARGDADEIEKFLTEDRLIGVDPAIRPGWRITLFSGPDRATMVWTIHHALIDGTSMALVLEELGDLLQGVPLGSPPEQNLSAYSAALPQQDKAAAKAFFTAMFATEIPSRLLVSSLAGEPCRMALVSQSLSVRDSDALRTAVRGFGATLLNAVQLAWGLVLSRWTGQSTAGFGLVDSGRRLLPGLDRTVGCLISTLPMQLQIDGATGLADALAGLRKTTVAMRQHAHASLTDVRRWAGLPGSAALFDTIVMYAQASLSARMRALGGVWSDWTVRLIEEGAAPLTLAVADGPELHLLIEYDPARVPAGQARQIIEQIAFLLAQMAHAPAGQPLGALEMLPPQERADLLRLGQPHAPLYDAPVDLAARFEGVAAVQPDALALIEGATGQAFTFAALDQAANALAMRLYSAGIGKGDVVALHLPRGAAHVVSILAVLKRGAAFLPLDPDLPGDWRAGLLAKAEAKALIATAGSDLGHPLRLAPDLAERQALAPARAQIDAETLAYVLFTSGSTGEPKAVRGLAGALSAHATATIAAYGLTAQDRVLQFAGLGFDVALEEILPTLLAGGTLVTRDPQAAGSVRACLDLIDRHRISVANLPASFWHVLVDELDALGQPPPATLRLMVTGSERIRPSALRTWRALAPDISWINGYGPTEATITATAFVLPGGAALPEMLDDVPIGRPLGHAQVVLRAPDGSLTPRGGRGMLWIGGPAVTGGYLNDATRSAQVFTDNPFGPGRLYCTGDQAIWRADGLIGFLGRRDRQIKLRGHRIDLNQIEQQLTRLEGVRQVHVAITEEGPARLLAWVLHDPDRPLALIQKQAKQVMPGAMVPQLIGIDHLPVGPNGKIDVRALPMPEFVPARAPAGPDDALTRSIAACMAEVLERDSVPSDASFSDMGGDSLLGLRLVSLIEQRTGHELQTADLHNSGSARALADLLQRGVRRPRYTITIQPNGTKPALFAIHVLGRHEDLYRPLSAALGPDQPFFGLSVGIPRHLDDINVERTARLYFDEILAFHPAGPIGLVAVSMAAYFAFELAQLLRAAGREVRVLALLDAIGPGGRPPLVGRDKLRAHWQQVRKHGPLHFVQVLKNKIDRSRENREVLHSLPDQINPLNLIAANVCAVESYRPQPYGGPLTVFRADRSFWDSPEAIASALGWISVAEGGMQMFDLPGTHLSILEPGNVDVLAGHLARLMAGPPPAKG